MQPESPTPTEDPGPDRPWNVRGRVVMADVDSVVVFTARLRALDYRYGGGRCRDAAVSLLPSALALLGRPCADDVSGQLRAAVADLHNLAGWSCFDTGLTDAAAGHFRTALTVAARGDHTSLASNVYYRLGRLSLHHNDVGRAMTEFQLGERAAAAGGSALAGAVISANRAWAQARMGRSDDVAMSLARAREEFMRASDEPVPAWAAFFTATDFTAITGIAYTELARTADPRYAEFAAAVLSTAVDGYGPGMARSRAFSLISFAVCHLLDDQVDAAVELGNEAVDRCEVLTSTRAVERLRPLRDEAARRRSHPGALALVKRIRAFRPAVLVPHPRRRDDLVEHRDIDGHSGERGVNRSAEGIG
ncbi:tetratricopeptide repeat protein [Actinosynnema sp. NPDC023658]|uniref:tetratricopeptide repeat protein n=1 Tax=Actinosynnema sp. NPDC023658 TaxID=3155465 RepID=UPI0033F3C015